MRVRTQETGSLMKTDQFGRMWLDHTEECPNEIRCFRCGEIPYKQGNPYGACLIDITRSDRAALHVPPSTLALCSPCAIAWFEWMHPGMAADPAYIAAKDQATAGIPEAIRIWNECADVEHRTDAD